MADRDDDIIISRTTMYSSKLGQELTTLRNNDDLTDFSLKTRGKVVKCHGVVIAASSPVFKAMLKSKMKEATEKQVMLDNISPEALDIIVEYIYTGETRIPTEVLKDVVEAADYLQMDELKKMCIDQASPVIQPDNVISWFKFSDKMNLTELLSQCSQILTSQLDEIKAGQEFLELSISELSTYISEANRNEVDPDDLVGASFDWVNADPQGRSEVMADLLKTIPLEKCSLQCIREEEEKHEPLLESNVKAYKLITKSLVQIAGKEPVRKKRSKMISDSTLLLVGGKYSNQCWLLDSASSLMEFSTIPAEHHHQRSSFCATPEGFAVTGGIDSDDAAMFHMVSKKWKKLPHLMLKRSHHGSIFVKNLLFVISGCINGSLSDSVHYLNERGTWHTAPDIPEPVWHSSGAVVDTGEDVFVLDSYSTNKLFKMSIDTKSWVNKATLPGDVSGGARMIRVNKDKFCVAGGSKNILAWYTPSTDTWVHGAKPLLTHRFGAVLHHHNTIMILGGEDQKKVESYDMDTGVWSVCDWEMPAPLMLLHGLML